MSYVGQCVRVRFGVLLLFAILLVLASCSDDTGSTDADERQTQPYAVLRDDAWSLREAVDPPADDPVASIDRPALAWYAEYVRAAPSFDLVRLSGHEVAFDDARSEMERVGFELRDVNVENWSAAGGTADDDPAGPTILLLENGGSTFMLLSYDIELETLATLADAVEPVDESGWIGAGGVVR